jgi:type VI secretion system protein ImpB
MKGMAPRLAFSVENKLSDAPDAGQLNVELNFEGMDDFSPERVAQQVKPLKELLDLRTRLSDLRGSLQGNDKLDDMLFEAVTNTEAREKLRAELGKDGGEK